MSWYRPRAFAVDDRASLIAFMHAHPFATIVTHGGEILTSHVPVLASANGDDVVLRGHLARANDQWRLTDTTVPAAALFRGASHYISPNWYPAKEEHGRVVPTYDYEVVEARGPIRFFDDPQDLRALVAELTAVHERTVGGDWRIDDAPGAYIDAQLAAIVGFEIRAGDVRGAFKLSQNRSRADRDGTADGLDALGSSDACTIARRIREAGSP